MINKGHGPDNVNYFMYECGSEFMSRVLWACETQGVIIGLLIQIADSRYGYENRKCYSYIFLKKIQDEEFDECVYFVLIFFGELYPTLPFKYKISNLARLV